MEILTFDKLENDNGNVEFEGRRSRRRRRLVLRHERRAPGRGPSLHTHDYPEVLITLEGQATLHTSEGDVEVDPGT
jgi:quercetin dioxygenase-like cupin family protein